MAIDRKLTRPVVKLTFRKRDWWMEGIGLIVLVSYWGALLYHYLHPPESVPDHFHSNGSVDAYGSTSSVWALAKVATALYALMTLLTFFPRYFNYGVVEITEENAEKQYQSASLSIRYLKLFVLIIFVSLSLMIQMK